MISKVLGCCPGRAIENLIELTYYFMFATVAELFESPTAQGRGGSRKGENKWSLFCCAGGSDHGACIVRWKFLVFM